MRTTLRRLLGGLLCFLLAASASAIDPLPPGISGAWFNPQQSGHGLSIIVHSPEHALVYWYTGDAHGNPLLLYTEARFDGTTLRGEAFDSRGIRFGEFNPATHRLERWGRLELELPACDRLVLRYNADGPAGGPAFGSGAIEMRKLAGVVGSPCLDPRVGVGLLNGTLRASETEIDAFQALFSADGTAWVSIDRGRRVDGAVLVLHSQGQAPGSPRQLYVGEAYPEPSLGRLREPSFNPVERSATTLQLQLDPLGLSYAGTIQQPSRPTTFPVTLAPAPGAEYSAATYRRDVTIAALAGSYADVDSMFITNVMNVKADGTIEGLTRYPYLGPECRYSGRVSKTISPSIEFEVLVDITHCGERNSAYGSGQGNNPSYNYPYSGRAWVDGFDANGKPARLRIAAVRADAAPLLPSLPWIGFQFSAPRVN